MLMNSLPVWRSLISLEFLLLAVFCKLQIQNFIRCWWTLCRVLLYWRFLLLSSVSYQHNISSDVDERSLPIRRSLVPKVLVVIFRKYYQSVPSNVYEHSLLIRRSLIMRVLMVVFSPIDWESMLVRNLCIFLQVHTTLQPIRSSFITVRTSELSCVILSFFVFFSQIYRHKIS
jgi:hypothetical protein